MGKCDITDYATRQVTGKLPASYNAAGMYVPAVRKGLEDENGRIHKQTSAYTDV